MAAVGRALDTAEDRSTGAQTRTSAKTPEAPAPGSAQAAMTLILELNPRDVRGKPAYQG
jgi:hypothetical protein